ncbi:MAG: SDR family oxidoreductase [Chloroflexi bacterium]|nr:SDR family oxidoreductase [Chloroflexota bacterium]MYK60393.1 SDR family oxidoreductase [Chloroflexota bacterium]
MQSDRPKAALIVGAKRVGQIVARRLARDGINLAIAYRNSAEEAQLLAASISSVDTALIQADLSDEHQVRGAVLETVGALGRIDYVVNLASDYPYAPFDELDGAAWDRAMATAKGSYLLGVHAARQMRRNPGPNRGHIIMFGDWAAEETPYNDYLPYLTAKAAIHFMTRCLAAEVASFGVRVNAVAPGPTMRPPEITPTDWNRAIAAKAPLQQESSVADIAEIIATLIHTSSITGEIIRVDSGRHIRGV